MKKISITIIKIIAGLVLLFTLPNYYVIMYSFSEGKPFNGDAFYNPYQRLSQTWIKANFHAHSKMHGGLAYGENTVDEMYAKYDSMEYELPAISNYNSILPNKHHRSPFITAYEHGLNIGSVHRLVINSHQVFKWDYPLFQRKSHKQFIINRINDPQNLVALAHPSFKKGYTKKEAQLLNNYELFEGMSVRANSIAEWDAALSSGHAVWLISNDDSHDVTDAHSGVCWNMLNISDTSAEAIAESLKKGRFYGTRGWAGQEMHRLNKVSVDSGYYYLELSSKADSIILKSDNGKTVKAVANTAKVNYKIKPENTYIRAEIFDTETWNTYTKSYLNPVVRMENGELVRHNNIVKASIPKTLLHHILLLAIHFLLLKFMFKRFY